MPLKMFRSRKSVKTLTDNVEHNLATYKNGDFAEFLSTQYYATIDSDFDESVLENELICSKDPAHDHDNALLLWRMLKITPHIARELRFWILLTHSVGLAYTRARWPLGGDKTKNIRIIKDHYLATDHLRGLERNNALSRLWMSAYIASQVKSLNLGTALDILLRNTDFRANVVERVGLNRSLHVLDAIIMCTKRILDEGDEDFITRRGGNAPYRQWLIELNLEGGQKLLDAMDKAELEKLVNDLADKQRA